jgi:hypothetical protein
LIEEGILGECLRCSSSLGGLRISPLTPKYVLPRTTLLHSGHRKPPVRVEAWGRDPEPLVVADAIISHRSLKPTKAETEIRRKASLSHAFKFMSNDCFGRAFLVTVRHTGALLHTLHAKVEGNNPAMFVSDVHGLQERRSPIRWMGRIRLLDSPQFNYEPFNSNSVNIRSWSWNYRGCWHQTCPPIVTRYWMALNIPHCNSLTP